MQKFCVRQFEIIGVILILNENLTIIHMFGRFEIILVRVILILKENLAMIFKLDGSRLLELFQFLRILW